MRWHLGTFLVLALASPRMTAAQSKTTDDTSIAEPARRFLDSKSTNGAPSGAKPAGRKVSTGPQVPIGPRDTQPTGPQAPKGRQAPPTGPQQARTAPQRVVAYACNKAIGQPCAVANDCASGFCVDGVCCQSACDGLCMRCDGSGTCQRIPNGQDPDNECAGTGTCGGVCMTGTDPKTKEVSSRCVYPSSNVACVPDFCAPGSVTRAFCLIDCLPRDVANAFRSYACDGSGGCTTPVDRPCSPYACDKSKQACRNSCVRDDQCAPDFQCYVLYEECVQH